MVNDDPPPSSQVHSTKQQNAAITGLNDAAYDVHPDWVIEPSTVLETIHRHEHWAADRQLVWDALKRTGVRGNALQAFAHCGSSCYVQHSSSRGAFRLTSNQCRSRWCLPCQQARAARLRASVRDQLDQWNMVRFITLTLRHSPTPLSDQLDRLQNSYKELRRRDLWTASIRGAAAFVEVKVSEKTGLWHPHLHIIAVGGWIDQRELSREWHKITGDSSIVDVSLARSKEGVAHYVTAYVTKPLDRSVVSDPGRLDEAIIALKGRRLVNGTGTLKRISDAAIADGVDDWHTIARIDQLINDARRGDEQARTILAMVSKRDIVLDVDLSDLRPRPPDRKKES
jgi:hypothetical protein